MSAPACPELVHWFYEQWLNSELEDYTSNCCMYIVGCMFKGGYVNNTLPHWKEFNAWIEELKPQPEVAILVCYLDDIQRTEDDMKVLKVTTKLLTG